MEFLILYFLLPLFLYNIAVGIYCTLRHYRKDLKTNSSEFYGLLLLPSVGLGTWKYNQEVRKGKIPEYPLQWYIDKHMVPIHWGFVIVVTLCCMVASFHFLSEFGAATATDGNSLRDEVDDFLSSIGMFILMVVLGTVSTVIVILAYVSLIMGPSRRKKRIETQVFRNKYLFQKTKKDNV